MNNSVPPFRGDRISGSGSVPASRRPVSGDGASTLVASLAAAASSGAPVAKVSETLPEIVCRDERDFFEACRDRRSLARGARYPRIRADGVLFSDGASFRGLVLDGASFSGAVFLRPDFSGAHLQEADFFRARFDGGDFGARSFVRASFREAVFTGRTDFSLRPFRWANFFGASFERLDARGTGFSGADFSWARIGEMAVDDATIFRGARIPGIAVGSLFSFPFAGGGWVRHADPVSRLVELGCVASAVSA